MTAGTGGSCVGLSEPRKVMPTGAIRRCDEAGAWRTRQWLGVSHGHTHRGYNHRAVSAWKGMLRAPLEGCFQQHMHIAQDIWVAAQAQRGVYNAVFDWVVEAAIALRESMYTLALWMCNV